MLARVCSLRFVARFADRFLLVDFCLGSSSLLRFGVVEPPDWTPGEFGADAVVVMESEDAGASAAATGASLSDLTISEGGAGGSGASDITPSPERPPRACGARSTE